MSYVDMAVLAVLILAALVGLWRGVGKELIAFTCFVLALVACFLIADYCLRFVMEIEVIRNLALGDTFSIRKLIGQVINIETEGVLSHLYQPMLDRYDQLGGMAVWGATEAEYLSIAISLHIFTIVLTLVLFIAARILASIVGYILKIIFIQGEPNPVSRVLGLLVGAVKGVLVVGFGLFLISSVAPFGFASPLTEQINQSTYSCKACEIVYEATGERLYSDETLELMLKGAGLIRAEIPADGE